MVKRWFENLTLYCLAMCLITLWPQAWAACGPVSHTIEAVQGSDARSSYVDRTVTVRGVVTAVFQQADALNGFFIQSTDVSPQHSHGLFVYTREPALVGSNVQITGLISEHFEQTQIKPTQPIALCDRRSVPMPYVLNPSDFHDLEPFEGVLVQVPALNVTETRQLDRYGQFNARPKGKEWADSMILVDDGSHKTLSQSPSYFNQAVRLSVGQHIDSFAGIVSFAFDKYRIIPVGQINPEGESLSVSVVGLPKKDDGAVRLAAVNLQNLFNGSGNGRGFPTSRGARTHSGYQAQLARITDGLAALDADVFALSELENDGFGSKSAMADLLNALNKAKPLAQYQAVRFRQSGEGDDAIRNGIVYDAKTVSPISKSRSIANDLSRQWPKRLHRPSLLQVFRHIDSQEDFVVVANHFKSKGGGCENDTSRNRSQHGACSVERLGAAKLVEQWLNNQSDLPVILLGDFNSDVHEPAIKALAKAGYRNELVSGDAYSYVHRGQKQRIDHALFNSVTEAFAVASGYWSINAGRPIQSRFSDHDPVYLDLSF